MRRVRNTAIILHETEGILKQGPGKLKDPAKWKQRDSDILGHFIQVYMQIRNSRWYRSDKSWTTQGDKTLAFSIPAWEEFVYAAVYFRQFTMDKDRLFHDAVERYISHVENPLRQTWMHHELKGFLSEIDSRPFLLPDEAGDLTLRQLFDAFLYGAALMHKVPKSFGGHRQRLKEVYEKLPRRQFLLALNGGLQIVLNYIGRASVVINQDFKHWQETHSLPAPEILLHPTLFDAPSLIGVT